VFEGISGAMRSKLDNLEWLEPPAEHDMTRPGSGSEWFGAFVAMAVFVALALSGLMILLSSWGNAWFWLWVLPAGLLISLGVYGVLRGVSGMLRPAKAIEYSLTNLELEWTILSAQPAVSSVIQGRLRFDARNKKLPRTLTVVLELQPDHHPDENTWLNSTYCKPDAHGVYEFVLEVPRHRTVLGEVHGLLELNFNAQAAFSRVMLEPIAQTKPLEIVFQPSKAQQLTAFEHDDSDDLISRAYNGEQASAGWLRHHGGPYLQDFSLEEQSRVFTISFAELVDHLEKINWFANKVRLTLEPQPSGFSIVYESAVFKVIFRELDLGPVYSDTEWFTVLHETTLEREAFEAFMLHSDGNTLVLRGATQLRLLRSDGDNKQHPQAH
jgi:hypothetical protein